MKTTLVLLKENDDEYVLRKGTMCLPCKTPKANNTSFHSLLRDSTLPVHK